MDSLGKEHLRALFQPDTVAVIGASATPGKVGHTVVSNIIKAGYKGKLIPVNPKADSILGLDCLKSSSEIKGPLDLAVICIPPGRVIDELNALASLPLKAAIVITAGFKEAGKAGLALERELIRLAEDNHIALLGPNCLGLINLVNGLNASFASDHLPAVGNITFFSQSGALCLAILDWSLGQNLGFSKFISMGNKAVLSETELLEYLADDPDTAVILGYVESIANGQNFIQSASAVTAKKPVIMIKSGTTSAGAKAASSHTGAIAGSDQAYEAAFKQAGIIRARNMSFLFNLADAFASQPLPSGPNLMILTNSGGPGIMAADACAGTGLALPSPKNATIERMASFLPTYASLYNPVDIIGDADWTRYDQTLAALLDDDSVHTVLVMLTPTGTIDPLATSKAIASRAKASGKPVFACFMGGLGVTEGKAILKEAGIPCYAFPEPAIEAINAMYSYAEQLKLPPPTPFQCDKDLPAARAIMAKTRAEKLTELVEYQSQELARAYKLPMPRAILARTSDEAVAAANEIGYPVVLKVASPMISHKSDVGGVMVNLATAQKVRSAFMEITSRALRYREGIMLTGCLVQEMVGKGSKEVFVGFKRDPQFGPLVLFGLGGIYVEVLKDVSYRLAPISIEAAGDMIREVKSFPLLRGVRGEKPVNFRAIENIILTMSELAMDCPEIAEAEFNPIMVNQEEALVVDMRVIMTSGDD